MIVPCYMTVMRMIAVKPGIYLAEIQREILKTYSHLSKVKDYLIRENWVIAKTEGRLTKFYPTEKGYYVGKAVDDLLFRMELIEEREVKEYGSYIKRV